MVIDVGRASLRKSLAVSISAVWVASLICFSVLAFRGGMILQVLGPILTYPLVGLAYPLVVAFPLSIVVSTKRRGRFVVAFSALFMAAIGLMVLFLKTLPGLIGGYAAGVAAVSSLGCGLSYYLNRRSKFIAAGFLLGCWTFLGDYVGYQVRSELGGPQGVLGYASIYGGFLGSGLGAIVWSAQRTPAA